MNEREHDLMEAELKRIQPAKAPQELIDRMLAAAPAEAARQRQHRGRESTGLGEWWLPWLRWLAPASAVGLVVFVSVYQFPWAVQSGGLKADEVQLNHRLVSSFDAVAALPNGEPVRFRVQEWSDESVFHDSARRLVVERSTPRMEVVPVAFETY